MCDDSYILELNKVISDISDFENKIISDYKKREQSYKQTMYKIFIVKGIIYYIKNNTSKKQNIRYMIPAGFNETIIRNLLDDYLNKKLITLEFVNIDRVMKLPQSFDIYWDNDYNLIQYLLSLHA